MKNLKLPGCHILALYLILHMAMIKFTGVDSFPNITPLKPSCFKVCRADLTKPSTRCRLQLSFTSSLPMFQPAFELHNN